MTNAVNIDWNKWYNNWFYERFHTYPEEGIKQMVTETQTPEATTDAPTEAPAPVTLEDLKAKQAEIEDALIKAGDARETDKVLELATELTKVRKAVLNSQKDVNKDAIAGIEDSLKTGIQVLVENVKYQELTGEPIKNVLWFAETNEETNEVSIGLRINAGRRGPSSAGSASGNGRSVKANQTVTRTMPDGTVESLTVKEVVQTHADDDVRGNSLYEPKKAWSILFPRVNKTLDPKFSEPI